MHRLDIKIHYIRWLVSALMNSVCTFPVFYEEPFHEDDVGAAPWVADSHGGFTNEEYGAMRIVRDLSLPGNQAFESEDSLATSYNEQSDNSVHRDTDPLIDKGDSLTVEAHQNSGPSADSEPHDRVDAGIIQEKEELVGNQGHQTSGGIVDPVSHFVDQSFKNVDSLKRDEREASENKNSETLNLKNKESKQIEKKSDNSHDITNNKNTKSSKGEMKNSDKVGILKKSEHNRGVLTESMINVPENKVLTSDALTGKDAKALTMETKLKSLSNSEDHRKSRSAESDSYHWEPIEEDRKSWIMSTGTNNEFMPIVDPEFGMVNEVPDDDNVKEREIFDDSIDNNLWLMGQHSYDDFPDSRLVDESESINNIRSRSVSDDTLQLLLDEKASKLREDTVQNNAKENFLQVAVKNTKLQHITKSRQINSTDFSYETTTEFTTLPPPRVAKSWMQGDNPEALQVTPRSPGSSTKWPYDNNETDASKKSTGWKIFHLLEPPREETLDIFIGSGKKKRAKTLTILLPENEAIEEKHQTNEGLLLKSMAASVGAVLCKDTHPCVTVDKRNVGQLLGALLQPLVNEEPDNWRVRVHSDYAVDDAIEDLLDRLARDRSSVLELAEGNAVVQNEKMMPLPVIKGDLIEELPLAANTLDKRQTNQEAKAAEKRKRDSLSKDKPSGQDNLLDLEELKDDIADEPAKIRVKRKL